MNAPVILSEDIDPSKYSLENFYVVRQRFPELPDEMIARYLIARNNDVEKAIEQLEKANALRVANWPILKSSCINEMRSGKLYTHGFDREGRPLLIWKPGKNFPKERNLEETSRLLIFWVEKTLKLHMPPNKSKYTILVDRSDFTKENADMELMKHTSTTFQVSLILIVGCDKRLKPFSFCLVSFRICFLKVCYDASFIHRTGISGLSGMLVNGS
jgi:hypothetical protein